MGGTTGKGGGAGGAGTTTFRGRLCIPTHAKISAARIKIATPTDMQIMPVKSFAMQVEVVVAVLLVDVVKVLVEEVLVEIDVVVVE